MLIVFWEIDQNYIYLPADRNIVNDNIFGLQAPYVKAVLTYGQMWLYYTNGRIWISMIIIDTPKPGSFIAIGLRELSNIYATQPNIHTIYYMRNK